MHINFTHLCTNNAALVCIIQEVVPFPKMTIFVFTFCTLTMPFDRQRKSSNKKNDPLLLHAITIILCLQGYRIQKGALRMHYIYSY